VPVPLDKQILKAKVEVDTLGKHRLIQDSVLANDLFTVSGVSQLQHQVSFMDGEPVFTVGTSYAELLDFTEEVDVVAGYIRTFNEEVLLIDAVTAEFIDYYSNSFNNQVTSSDSIVFSTTNLINDFYSLGDSGTITLYDYTTSPFFADDYVGNTVTPF
jgi:hypothetical protein